MNSSHKFKFNKSWFVWGAIILILALAIILIIYGLTGPKKTGSQVNSSGSLGSSAILSPKEALKVVGAPVVNPNPDATVTPPLSPAEALKVVAAPVVNPNPDATLTPPLSPAEALQVTSTPVVKP